MDRPSLDRIDGAKGYVKGNVRVISHRANMLKNDATIEELELVLKDLRMGARTGYKQLGNSLASLSEEGKKKEPRGALFIYTLL